MPGGIAPNHNAPKCSSPASNKWMQCVFINIIINILYLHRLFFGWFVCLFVCLQDPPGATKNFVLHIFHFPMIQLSLRPAFEEVKQNKPYLSGCRVYTEGSGLSQCRRGYSQSKDCFTSTHHAVQNRQPQNSWTSSRRRIRPTISTTLTSTYNGKSNVATLKTKEQESRPSFLCSNASDI